MMAKITAGLFEESCSWRGETAQAGIDHDGDKDIFEAHSFARHEAHDDNGFTIQVTIEGSSQEEAGEKAMAEVNHLVALRNAAQGISTEEAVALLNCWADGLRRG